ncbi:hypothetical protein ABZ746_18555 [Streptomyces sp. NPDC020096]
MPPLTEASLRAAVTCLSLASVAQFELEFRQAWEEAVQVGSTVSMHTFLRRWGVFVAIKRWPERAARFRECERIVGESESRAERRAAAAEIGAMLAEAEKELAA